MHVIRDLDQWVKKGDYVGISYLSLKHWNPEEGQMPHDPGLKLKIRPI